LKWTAKARGEHSDVPWNQKTGGKTANSGMIGGKGKLEEKGFTPRNHESGRLHRLQRGHGGLGKREKNGLSPNIYKAMGRGKGLRKNPAQKITPPPFCKKKNGQVGE